MNHVRASRHKEPSRIERAIDALVLAAAADGHPPAAVLVAIVEPTFENGRKGTGCTFYERISPTLRKLKTTTLNEVVRQLLLFVGESCVHAAKEIEETREARN